MNEDGQLFETKKSAKLFLRLSICVIVAFLVYSVYQNAATKSRAETSFPQADCANAKNTYSSLGYRGLVEVEMRSECWNGYTSIPADWPNYVGQPTETSGYFIWFLGEKQPVYVPPPPANPVDVGTTTKWYQFCGSKNGGINVKPIWDNEEIHFSEANAGLESGHCSMPAKATIFRIAGKGRMIFRCVGCAEIEKEPQETKEEVPQVDP